MSAWRIVYLPEADKDLKRLDNTQRLLALKAIIKVSAKPQSKSEGGYGTPLGNKGAASLSGLYKIKLRDSGLRIVYKLIKTEEKMLVVILGASAENKA